MSLGEDSWERRVLEGVMIAGKLCALWSTVLGETFCDVASAADVKGAVRASEDVDKGVPA